MSKIVIFIPKYRRAEVNRLKWKHNHHKKPQYLMSEVNNAIRNNDDSNVLKRLWRDEFHMKYHFGR